MLPAGETVFDWFTPAKLGHHRLLFTPALLFICWAVFFFMAGLFPAFELQTSPNASTVQASEPQAHIRCGRPLIQRVGVPCQQSIPCSGTAAIVRLELLEAAIMHCLWLDGSCFRPVANPDTLRPSLILYSESAWKQHEHVCALHNDCMPMQRLLTI